MIHPNSLPILLDEATDDLCRAQADISRLRELCARSLNALQTLGAYPHLRQALLDATSPPIPARVADRLRGDHDRQLAGS